jgi:hypothetical protein
MNYGEPYGNIQGEKKSQIRRWRILLSSFSKGITFMFVILEMEHFNLSHLV